MPNPERITVVFTGDHATPTRGSKFRLLGLYKGECAGQIPPHAKSKTRVRSSTSLATVYFSQRMPRLMVRLGRSFHSSWKYGRINTRRNPRLHQEPLSEKESS